MNYSRLNKLAALLKSSGFHKEANQILSFANNKESFQEYSGSIGRDWEDKRDSTATKIVDLLLNLNITHPDELKDLWDKVIHHNDLKKAQLDIVQEKEIDTPFDSDEINAMLDRASEEARDAEDLRRYEDSLFGRHIGYPKY